MRRDFSVLKGENGLEPGDDYAASKATALAQLADAGVIEKLTQAVSMLDLFGEILIPRSAAERKRYLLCFCGKAFPLDQKVQFVRHCKACAPRRKGGS
jgi:hypothetical protein